MTVLQRVRDMFFESFDIPLHQAQEETDFRELVGVNGRVTDDVRMSLEEVFGIVFPPEEFERRTTVGELAQFVETALGPDEV
jgi:acyl carrier protein